MERVSSALTRRNVICHGRNYDSFFEDFYHDFPSPRLRNRNGFLFGNDQEGLKRAETP